MASKHELKILPCYFEAVIRGEKTFELRKNDRGFRKGDTFVLREWKDEHYTGRQYSNSISYVLEECEEYGLSHEYCIFCWKGE